MLEQIEKIFPGFLMRLRRLPLVAKVALLIAILIGAPALAWVYDHWAIVNAWLQREMRIPLYGLFLAALACGVIVVSVPLLAQGARVRRDLRRFLTEWLEFKEEFELLCIRIDSYLIRDREAKNGMSELDDLLPSVREYRQRRGRLRALIFRIGEQHLVPLRSLRWEALKAKSIRFREGEYLTPFSFLVDLGNPIAEWNHHHDEIWETLHLADEFVEYLCLKYPALKKLAAGRAAPNPRLQGDAAQAPRA